MGRSQSFLNSGGSSVQQQQTRRRHTSVQQVWVKVIFSSFIWLKTIFPFRSCRREVKDFSRRQTLPFQCPQLRIGRRMQSGAVSPQCLRPIVRKGGISQPPKSLKDILCKKHPCKEFNPHLINRLWATFCLDIFTQHQQAPTQMSVLLDHSPLSGFY